MSELISIVLPVYNGEKYLCESIESVIAQTYKNWELIIVDDCSTDTTMEIAKRYATRDSRIVYYRNEKNLKLPRNLNKGFSLTKGNYLTWTSDDNRFYPTALERMYNVIKNDDTIGLVYASYQIIDEAGKKHEVIRADLKGSKHIVGSNVVGACFMYTRKVYETIGEYDPELFLVEDFDYWQRVFSKFRALPVDEVLYEYRWHSGSLTTTKKQEEFNKALEKMLIKNIVEFGKLDIESRYFYYSCLNRCKKNQKGKNPYQVKYFWNLICFDLLYVLPHKLKRIFNR